MIKLSYSKLSTYQSCPKKYYYGYVERLQKIALDESDIAMEFGSAFHCAVALLWEKKPVEDAVQCFMDTYPTIEGQEDKHKNLASGVFLVKRYAEAYKNQIQEATVLEQEVLEEIDIGGIVYRVKLDIVYRNSEGIYFRDFKTKAYMPRYNYYAYCTQMDGYYYYCTLKYKECLGGIIDNCVIMAVSKPTLMHVDDPKQYDYSITETKYSKYYKEDKVYVSGYHAQFSSDLVHPSLDTIDDFKADVVDWHSKIEDDKTCCKNKGACYNYNRKCEYMELCETFDDEAIKETLYEPK